MSGPRYAATWAAAAERSGAQVMLGTQVTGWSGPRRLQLTGPAGRRELSASAVVLATGCRERPRSARLIAGSRPQGVMNTGTLQQLVHLEHRRVGSRAVVVGAEHVSFSALMTLRHAGARAVAMTTEQPRHQSFAAVRGRRPPLPSHTAAHPHRRERHHGACRVSRPSRSRTSTAAGRGADRLRSARADGRLDPRPRARGSRGRRDRPRAPAARSSTTAGRTSRPGLFAAGNVLHGAEPADVAALSGRHVAGAVRDHLAGTPWPRGGVAVRCVAAAALDRPGRDPSGRPARPRALPAAGGPRRCCDVRIRIAQDGRELAIAAADAPLARALGGTRGLLGGAGGPGRRAGSDLGALVARRR